MALHKRIYDGSVIGIGYSGQAGSTFPVLSMLSLLKREAAQEGRNLQTLLAFDPNANPHLSGVIETAARLLGIETTFLPEVSFQDYRHAIDHNKAFFYGEHPDIEKYVEAEVELFRRYRPSLVVSALRQTLHFSRDLYRRREGEDFIHLAIAYGILAGDVSHVGIPASLIPLKVPLFIENALGEITAVAKIVTYLKGIEGKRHLFHHAPPSYRTLSFPGFWEAFRGDMTLVPSSPLFLPGKLLPRTRLVGAAEVPLPLNDAQREKEARILQRIAAWKGQGATVAFVAMGTSGAALPRVIEALREIVLHTPVGVKMVIATTTLIHQQRVWETLKALEAEDHAVYSDWFDLSRIMPQADLYINHGGMNTLEIALRHGVPPLIVAPRQVEQGANSLRVRQFALGEVVWEHRMEDLPRTLRKMLNNLDAYRERIEAYRQRNARYYDREYHRQAVIESVNELCEMVRV